MPPISKAVRMAALERSLEKAKSPLAAKLANVKTPQPRSAPVWAGPESDAPNGGITQSLLGKFLSCRERFRLHVIEGLRPADTFNAHMEFGNAWHVAEEALAGLHGQGPAGRLSPDQAVSKYAQGLCRRYPMQQQEIDHQYNVIRVQFPEYVRYWSQHPDVLERTPLLQEAVFNVPLKLPSGRVVRLRGKWDSVDIIGKGKDAGVYLQENKTKSRINEEQIKRQLTFDLQTMLYIVALQEQQVQWNNENYSQAVAATKEDWKHLIGSPIKGVRYNVIRRDCPIRQHKPSKSNPQGEDKTAYYQRLRDDYFASDPQEWFMRWSVLVHPSDVDRFRRECLAPILENLADDYEWWADCYTNGFKDGYGVWDHHVRQEAFQHHRPRHFRTPYGIYNPMMEGNTSDLDSYLESGSEVGLQRVTELFPELKEGA